MLLREISEEQRPRERLLEYGVENLSDSELLALIFRNGCFGESVIDLSQRLIKSFGLSKLNNLSLNELMEVKGIGIAKACCLLAAFEIGNRVSTGKIVCKKINNANDVYSYFYPRLRRLKKERFYSLILDSKNKVIKEDLISVGTIDSSLVHPREIFRSSIKESGSSIVLVHNHPSGDCEPSTEDIIITKRIRKAGKVVGIKVVDHVIVGEGRYFSFEENFI